MSIDGLVHWLQALLDALGQSDAVIVAHSHRARFWRACSPPAAPEYVPALILINGGAFPSVPAFVPRLMNLPLVGNLAFGIFGRMTWGQKTVERLIYNQDAPRDDLLKAWQNNLPAFNDLMRTLLFSPYPNKQTPLMPTLLLWGANDSMMTIANGERLKREIPGAQLVPIAECGHLPSVETSDVFVFQVKAFLDQLSRPTIPATLGVRLLQPVEA